MTQPPTLEEIKRILPHRYPFLLVDRILSIELSKRIVGLKNVTANEPFFVGHFPHNPIMPLLSTPEHLGNPEVYLMSLDKVRFRRPVVPGDQIIQDIQVLRPGKKFFKMVGKATVDGTLVAEAEFMAMIGKGED
jgi:3-hydroxymyristoyl/3-hydroxydecanoyl-(acyl carrier protein) dehydratase